MTKTLGPGIRILALDLHPQRYGFAVLETPANLLDWGVRRRYRDRGSRRMSSIQKGLRLLLDMWRPSLVVIKESSRPKTARMRRLLAGITRESRQRRIPVRCLAEQSVRRALGDESQATKHAMASTVCRHFPFLASALPSPRRAWESEDYRMHMFTAAALALAGSTQRNTANNQP